MKTTILALAMLVLCVGVAGTAAADDPIGGYDCTIKKEPFAMVWGTGTPLDGTTIDRPFLECYF